jgi:hypothetical protein
VVKETYPKAASITASGLQILRITLAPGGTFRQRVALYQIVPGAIVSQVAVSHVAVSGVAPHDTETAMNTAIATIATVIKVFFICGSSPIESVSCLKIEQFPCHLAEIWAEMCSYGGDLLKKVMPV